MKKKIGKVFSVIFLLITTNAFATTYNIPSQNNSLIGQVQYSSSGLGDTIATVLQRYNLGRNALEAANPQLNIEKGLSYGSPLQLATQHLLPNQTPRQGIVVNLPEMRMYYYTSNGKVLTFPIGIGKMGKTIPITNAIITKKTINPTWVPPEDIREFNLGQGIVLPKIMPPGPDNPLGPYAIYMSVPTYLIHSTIFPESIGKRASFGCIRMYETDIKQFFPAVEAGIPVAIINAPVKVGFQGERLYVEAHRPLEEHHDDINASLPGVVQQILTVADKQPVLVDWQAVAYISEERDGMPHDIGLKISG